MENIETVHVNVLWTLNILPKLLRADCEPSTREAN